MWMSSEELIERSRFCREPGELERMGRALMRRGDAAAALRLLARAWGETGEPALTMALRGLLRRHPELIEDPVSGRAVVLPRRVRAWVEETFEHGREMLAMGWPWTPTELPRMRVQRASILLFFVGLLDADALYSAEDLSWLLGAMLEDYRVLSDACHVRRYMQEHAMLSRTVDGSLYWVNPSPNVVLR